MCRKEWSEHYQTYCVHDDTNYVTMACSPMGVSIATTTSSVILSHDTFCKLAAEMIQHAKSKEFVKE